MSETEKVAIYVRVSTTKQELEGQERALREDAERRGWDVVEVYREKITATGKSTRDEYERALLDMASPSRPWSVLSCWALDRFSREERWTKALDQLIYLEREHHAKFHFVEDTVLDTPGDGTDSMQRDLLLAVFAIVAKWEAKRISERTKLAMAEIKAGRRKTKSGLPPGRQRRVWQEKVDLIVRLKDVEKLSWRLIAQKVGLPKGTCSGVYSLAKRGLLRIPSSGKGEAGGGEG